MDNASYHVNSEIKNFLIKNKLKILTNCPYYSTFNAIEYEFRNIKSILYKKLINDEKELMNVIEEILSSKKNEAAISKIYLDELKRYRKYALEHKNDDLEKLFE